MPRGFRGWEGGPRRETWGRAVRGPAGSRQGGGAGRGAEHRAPAAAELGRGQGSGRGKTYRSCQRSLNSPTGGWELAKDFKQGNEVIDQACAFVKDR